MEATESRNYCVHLNFLVTRGTFSSILSWATVPVRCDFQELTSRSLLLPFFDLPDFLRSLQRDAVHSWFPLHPS